MSLTSSRILCSIPVGYTLNSIKSRRFVRCVGSLISLFVCLYLSIRCLKACLFLVFALLVALIHDYCIWRIFSYALCIYINCVRMFVVAYNADIGIDIIVSLIILRQLFLFILSFFITLLIAEANISPPYNLEVRHRIFTYF